MHTVVWVDDDPLTLMSYETYMEELHPDEFKVLPFFSAKDALQFLDQNIPDIIISDMQMKGMSGREFLVEVRRRRQLDRVPFFFATGTPGIESHSIGLELGADDYLQKPLDMQLVGLRIRNTLRRVKPTRPDPFEYDFFVSYASEDRARIVPLIDELKTRGARVWFDRDIVVGADFRKSILNVLDKCRNVLVLWTDNSVISEWVVQEAVLASAKLIPIRVGNAAPPIGFQTFQHLSAKTLGPSTVPGLAESIIKLLGSEPTLKSRR